MNDFADELQELIDKWRQEHMATSDEDIVIALAAAIQEIDPDVDD